MAVKIRMQRGGATHNPHYRVVVTDVRSRRDGRFVEKVGVYDPKNKDQGKQYALDLERVDYWLSVGAQPSDTVRSLIKRARRQTTVADAPVKREEAVAAPAAAAPVAEEVVMEEQPLTGAAEVESADEATEAEAVVEQEEIVAEDVTEEDASTEKDA